MRRRAKLTVLVAIAFVMATPALATTYKMMRDSDLADQAAIIAVVRIAAAGPAPDGTPWTAYQVALDRGLKGELPGEFTVMVPGGVGRDGRGLKVWGAPSFQPGERALLFLERHQDGTYRILHLMLGAFRETETGGRRLAVRNLSKTEDMARPGEHAEPAGARDFDLFADWLAARAAADSRDADYVTDVREAPAPPLVTTQPFTLLGAARWFAFDTRTTGTGSVAFSTSPGGQAGNPGSASQAQAALQAWTNDPDTPINHFYAGTTTASGGLRTSDFTNTILWDDPGNQLAGSFNCRTGGLLAIGGFWFSGSGTWKGSSYWQIVEGDIVVQDGAACFFTGNGGENGEETLGHELGHTLALGHSCGVDAAGGGDAGPCDTTAKNEALMRSFAHGDGRGALLGTDDRAAIRFLYEPPPTPSISIADVFVIETNRGSVGPLMVFIVRLNLASPDTVTVSFATANGSALGMGVDYDVLSGVATFLPGETARAVTVRVNGDSVQEPNETFYLNLSNPSGATLADVQAVGTIIDDDAPIANPATVYRLRHPSIGSYLFTVYPFERDSAQLQYGYIYEGVCCKWFTSPAGDGRVPMYRLFSSGAGEYFFTISAQERDSAVALYGYVYEGVAAYGHPSSTPAAPRDWFRLRLGNKHIYTIYPEERDSAVDQYGFVYEGVSCYLPPP